MRWLIALLLALPGAAQVVDREWFERQMHEELVRHRTLVPTESGFLHADFDREWRRLPARYASAVGQTRQIYVQCVGWRITGNEEFRRNVRAGTDFLLEKFADPEHEGWCYRVSPGGEVLDDSKDSYSFAFVIYGCVNAWRAAEDPRYLEAAERTWRVMKRKLRDGEVFLRPRATADYGKTLGTNSQNPMMHLFEALLELYEATGSEEVRRDAGNLADAITGRLMRGRELHLPELFDANWEPLPEEKGGRIEVGHQFEWAWLLSRAVELGFPEEYLETGHRLIDYGMRGYDRGRGGIYSRLNYAGEVSQYRQGRWEQCEFLRALIRYGSRHGRSDLWERYRQTMAHVRDSFIDREFGGWFRSWYPDKEPEGNELRKGNEWLSGYHTMNLYLEALAAGGSGTGKKGKE